MMNQVNIEQKNIKQLLLFTMPTCPKCPAAKAFVNRYNIKCDVIEVNDDASRQKALELHVRSAPQFIVEYEDGTCLSISQEEVVRLMDDGLLPK